MFDQQCSLLSLPLLFETTAETSPVDIPYVRAPTERIEIWKTRLPHDGSLVGITWSGSQATTKDQERSIAFDQLAPVLATPGIRFIVLQKDVRPNDMRSLRQHGDVIDFSSELNDFSDTAAVIAQLDLVITVDTAVAHLAGAMGQPVWILLPYHPIFGGCWIVTTARGIRAQGSFANPNKEVGRSHRASKERTHRSGLASMIRSVFASCVRCSIFRAGR